MIGQAPVTFILLVVVIALMMYFIVRHQFSDRIESLEGRVKLRDDRIADYEAKLKGATPEQAASLIANMETRLAALEPRQLAKDKLASLRNALAVEPSSVMLALDMAAHDSKRLHDQLQTAFADAGWTVQSASVMGIGNPPRTGLAVIAADTEAPEVTTIVAALEKAGLLYDLQRVGNAPSEHAGVELLVTSVRD